MSIEMNEYNAGIGDYRGFKKLQREHKELLESLERVVEYHVPKINPFSDAAILSAISAIKKAKGE